MKKTLTVKELREKLIALPPEADSLPVVMEGCDCDGECEDAELIEGSVYLYRLDE